MKLAFGTVAALGLVLAGCAEQPLDLNPKNVASVHRVTVAGPADPVPLSVTTRREETAQKAVTAAAAIPFAGVLGAAVAGGVAGAISAEIQRETSKPLNDAVAAEKYSYASSLQAALVAALGGQGYEVSQASAAHKAGRFAEKVEVAAGQSDLIVDVVASAVCTDVGTSKDAHFRPVVRVQVKLTRPGDTAAIMNKTFVYDDAVVTPDAFNIKGDPKYDIADYAALKANVIGCLDGIKATAAPLAEAVGRVIAQKKQLAAN